MVKTHQLVAQKATVRDDEVEAVVDLTVPEDLELVAKRAPSNPKGLRKRPNRSVANVPEESDRDLDNQISSEDEDAMKERAATLWKEINQSHLESQPQRDNLWRLQQAEKHAQDTLREARTIYNFECTKRKMISKPKSAEMNAIHAKLERIESREAVVQQEQVKRVPAKKSPAKKSPAKRGKKD
jgi:hypothetical protein